ncbi:hypothetical protein NIBR502773_13910 [Pseudomonas sp. NIBRBAC000502773]|nr:hypothetical protein NIBR502773_13910 [Pseudomonas sp. NIBRBAC000502773]
MAKGTSSRQFVTVFVSLIVSFAVQAAHSTIQVLASFHTLSIAAHLLSASDQECLNFSRA